MRGRVKASADQVATVVEALGQICPAVHPHAEELRAAVELAEQHGLTVYDAAYAAVARNRDATLVTLDRDLLDAGLGRRPNELAAGLGNPR